MTYAPPLPLPAPTSLPPPMDKLVSAPTESLAWFLNKEQVGEVCLSTGDR